MLLLRGRLVGAECRVRDARGFVVGAGFAVFVWFGLEAVFVLGVFAGEEGGALAEGLAAVEESDREEVLARDLDARGGEAEEGEGA